VHVTLSRQLAAEAIGTAFLLAVVVGSGIMGERFAGGNVAIALLANGIAMVVVSGCSLHYSGRSLARISILPSCSHGERRALSVAARADVYRRADSSSVF
jgi:hypothetical protein